MLNDSASRGSGPPIIVADLKQAVPTMATGRIVDNNGQIQYHIVTTLWAWGIVALFAIIFSMALILMVFLVQNRNILDRIETKQDSQQVEIQQEQNRDTK